MQNAFTIARTSLRVYLSDRGNLFNLLILPVIMTLFLGGVFSGGGPERIQVDVLDEDNSPQSAQLIEAVRALNPALRICPQDGEECGNDLILDEQTSIERVRNGDSRALLVIPEGFGAALAAFQTVELPYYSGASEMTGDAVLQSVEAVLQRINGSTVAARVGVSLLDALDVETESDTFGERVYERAQAAWADPPAVVAYTETAAEDASMGGFNQSVPGMATFFVVFSVLGAGMYGLLKERTDGTLPRLASMPIRRAEIIAGKILTYFVIGMLQFAIVFVVGLFVGVHFGRDLLALLLVIVTYTLCITALSFALAPRMRSEEQVSALTTMLGMVMAALGGAWWPLDIAPPFMQVIGHLTPVAWAMDAFRQLFFFSGGLMDVLPSLTVLLLATVVLFTVGIRAFKFN
jgi:ABC-2 type transport system permease protein